jgi:tetratricopeptide (TPR) repeat protein
METTQDSSKSLSSYISSAERRLSDVVRKQFGFMIIATLLPTIVLIIVVGIVPLFLRQPANQQLLSAIQESNSQISDLLQALLSSTSVDPNTASRAIELALKQSALHQQAVEELRRTQTQITPEAQSILQLVGSAAILALLGALGLQRLQNIDTEINNVRESVFKQAEARAEMIKESLRTQIDDEIQKQFAKSQEDIQRLLMQGQQAISQMREEMSQSQQNAQSEIRRMHERLTEVKVLLDKYPWLRDRGSYESVAKIQHLSSLEEAQRLAEKLRRQGDYNTAIEALKAAVDKNLVGDYIDFHNAFNEAMRLNDPALALQIVERGLSCFPDDPDLIANKARALCSLGRPFEAKEFIENWRKQKPAQFARSWRPIVFYKELFDSIELTDEDFTNLKAAFDEVSKKLPYAVKVWAEYGDLMVKRGDVQAAESIFKQGLGFNPLSQQLNFMLGDLLLKQGKSNEAVKYLEKALAIDYQDQYQHDVNQYAVRVRLAQAYEAVGDLEKAQLLYKSVLGDPKAFDTIRDYSRNRLAAINLQKGKLPEQDGEGVSPEGVLRLLKSLSEGKEETNAG